MVLDEIDTCITNRYTLKKSGDIFLRGRKLRKSFLELPVLVRLDSSTCPIGSEDLIK